MIFGFGRLVHVDGTIYDGTWREGTNSIEGKSIYDVRSTFDLNDRKIDTPSKAKLIYTDGSTFDGDINEGIPHG